MAATPSASLPKTPAAAASLRPTAAPAAKGEPEDEEEEVAVEVPTPSASPAPAATTKAAADVHGDVDELARDAVALVDVVGQGGLADGVAAIRGTMGVGTAAPALVAGTAP